LGHPRSVYLLNPDKLEWRMVIRHGQFTACKWKHVTFESVRAISVTVDHRAYGLSIAQVRETGAVDQASHRSQLLDGVNRRGDTAVGVPRQHGNGIDRLRLCNGNSPEYFVEPVVGVSPLVV
jgi:hypothetical protein